MDQGGEIQPRTSSLVNDLISGLLVTSGDLRDQTIKGLKCGLGLAEDRNFKLGMIQESGEYDSRELDSKSSGEDDSKSSGEDDSDVKLGPTDVDLLKSTIMRM